MKIENAPKRVRAFITCLWILPAMFLSYLFQNRDVIFLFEISFVYALFYAFVYLDERSSNRAKFLIRTTAFLPVLLNSYFVIQRINFHGQVPAFLDVISFIGTVILFSVPFLLIFIIFLGPLSSIPIAIFIYFSIKLCDFIYTLIKKSRTFKFCAIVLVSFSLLFVCINIPENFSISALPPVTIKSQDDIDETETVYVSTYGECYHSNSHCSGMKYARSVTLAEAKKSGHRACSKCYKKKH